MMIAALFLAIFSLNLNIHVAGIKRPGFTQGKCNRRMLAACEKFMPQTPVPSSSVDVMPQDTKGLEQALEQLSATVRQVSQKNAELSETVRQVSQKNSELKIKQDRMQLEINAVKNIGSKVSGAEGKIKVLENKNKKSAMCGYAYSWKKKGVIEYHWVFKEVDEVGSYLNGKTGVYTAGIAGVYEISVAGIAQHGGLEVGGNVRVDVLGAPGYNNQNIWSITSNTHPLPKGSYTYDTVAYIRMMKLKAGEKIYLEFKDGGIFHRVKFCITFYSP